MLWALSEATTESLVGVLETGVRARSPLAVSTATFDSFASGRAAATGFEAWPLCRALAGGLCFGAAGREREDWVGRAFGLAWADESGAATGTSSGMASPSGIVSSVPYICVTRCFTSSFAFSGEM